MANNVNNASGEQLLLLIGNGATPEVFIASATINTTRSLDLSAKASVTELADTVTPSNPAATVRQIISTDLKFSGAGIADAPSLLALIQKWQSGASFNAKIQQNRTGAAGGWTGVGTLVITSLQVAGARGDMQTFNITAEQGAGGSFVFTANA